MNIIFLLFIIFWECFVITNANVQEKDAKMMDISDGCFGEHCTASSAEANREIRKENQTQTKLLEQHPLDGSVMSVEPQTNIHQGPTSKISTGRSEKPKVNVVNRSGSGEKLETADYFKQEILSIKKRQKRRVFFYRRRAQKVRLVAIKAKTMAITNTKQIKDTLKESINNVNTLFEEGCGNITQESQMILEKLKSFASETKTNIKDAIRDGKLLKAQALAATNVDEASKLSFINTVKLPSIYFPSVKGIINLVESNAIKTLNTSTSLDNKMVKLETTNEGLRKYIDTQTQSISNLGRKCAIKFIEIGQLSIDKLKVYSDNTVRLFTELADTYGKMFLALGEENYAQEVDLWDVNSQLILQIKQSCKDKDDNVFRSTSGQFDSFLDEVKKDIEEIVKYKYNLQ